MQRARRLADTRRRPRFLFFAFRAAGMPQLRYPPSNHLASGGGVELSDFVRLKGRIDDGEWPAVFHQKLVDAI